MLGIKKTYDAKTGEIVEIVAKNDCEFECDTEHYFLLDEPKGKPGFASFGVQSKDTPFICEKYDLIFEYLIYKNCNSEETMFEVIIDANGVYIIKDKEKHENNA